MTAARLNVFQKTLRFWETYHPYNAAQAMELAGEFSAEAVATSFNRALADLGLGDFVCEKQTYFVEPSCAAVEVDRAGGGFEALMDAAMNRPFAADRSMPFRPFDVRDGGRRLVGLTYQHWVADSVSIRMLMRQWLTRLTAMTHARGPGLQPVPSSSETGVENPCHDVSQGRRVRLPATGLLGAFGPAAAGWSVLAQTATLLGYASRMKRMRRVDPADDAAVRVILRRGPDGLIAAVRQRARAAGVTVGDAMLAAAAGAVDDFGPARPTPRRPDLSLGTIVDLRARGSRYRNDRESSDIFGLYLGFTMTDFSQSDLSTPARLLARTAAARRTGLARRAAEASQLNMTLAYGVGRAKGIEKLREFYRKRFPLAAGLSSVNMTPGWAGEAHPSPLAAYHRVSPTGPMLPLVLTPTTLGDRLDLCCTYRSALTDASLAARVIDAFFERLAAYA